MGKAAPCICCGPMAAPVLNCEIVRILHGMEVVEEVIVMCDRAAQSLSSAHERSDSN